MSDKHPIDEFFRQQLNDHSYEAPMHLWEGIDTQRQAVRAPHRPFFGLYKWCNLFSILALLSTGAVLWATHDTTGKGTPNEKSFERVDPAAALPATDVPLAVSPSVEPTNKKTVAFIAEPVSRYTAEAVTTALPNLPARMNTAQINIRALAPIVTVPPAAEASVMGTIPPRVPILDYPPRTDDVTCAKFEERRIWRSTVDFIVSPDLVSRELEAVSPQYEEYAAARNTTEHFRYGFSAGVRFSTIAPSGLAVRSGLNYSQINEQFSYRNDQEERITITTEYGPNGQVIGTDTVVDYFSTRRTVNNRYTTIDIPLIFGYEFNAGSNFGVAINGGTFINMLFTQQGEFLSPATFEPVQFSGDTPDTYHAYRNRLGLAFYGSVGLTYRISDDLDLLVEPHIKWRPQSITAPGYVLQQRFFTSGLFLGLRKRV